MYLVKSLGLQYLLTKCGGVLCFFPIAPVCRVVKLLLESICALFIPEWERLLDGPNSVLLILEDLT